MTKEHEYQSTKQWGEVKAATGKRKGEYIISGAIEWETDKAIKIGHIWHKPEYEWEHIENPYKDQLTPGVCKECGCTWDNACQNPEHGNCWWVDDTETLCSHCYIDEIKNDPKTIHPNKK